MVKATFKLTQVVIVIITTQLNRGGMCDSHCACVCALFSQALPFNHVFSIWTLTCRWVVIFSHLVARVLAYDLRSRSLAAAAQAIACVLCTTTWLDWLYSSMIGSVWRYLIMIGYSYVCQNMYEWILSILYHPCLIFLSRKSYFVICIIIVLSASPNAAHTSAVQTVMRSSDSWVLLWVVAGRSLQHFFFCWIYLRNHLSGLSEPRTDCVHSCYLAQPEVRQSLLMQQNQRDKR